MKTVILTSEAYAVVCSWTPGDFTDTSTLLPDGTRSIELNEATVDRLENHGLAGESLSDVIVRLASGKPN